MSPFIVCVMSPFIVCAMSPFIVCVMSPFEMSCTRSLLFININSSTALALTDNAEAHPGARVFPAACLMLLITCYILLDTYHLTLTLAQESPCSMFHVLARPYPDRSHQIRQIPPDPTDPTTSGRSHVLARPYATDPTTSDRSHVLARPYPDRSHQIRQISPDPTDPMLSLIHI